MTVALPADLDEVTIQVGELKFKGWQNVSITKSCELMPNTWSLGASAQFLNDAKSLAGTRPGQKCLIYIGSDLVITGWIDRRSIPIDAHNHQVMLSGRGNTRNQMDCSANLVNGPAVQAGGMSGMKNALDLARRLCTAYGITAIMGPSAVGDLGVEIPYVLVSLGDTPYSIIESVARYAGFLVYENELGNLVLDRVGTKVHASGFTLPGNVEAINGQQSVDQRFSQYVVVFSGTDQTANLDPLINRRADKFDPTLGEYRLKIIVSSQFAQSPGATAPTPGAGDPIASQRANWECARRIGRSQNAPIMVGKWRDTAGKLWTPNWLAPLDAPAADISDAKWIIGSVTFRKDLSGTHADLNLMPPDAFTPDPNPLNLFDAQLANAPTVSQSPAPASTTSPPPT